MTREEELFHQIATGLPEAKGSKMFGALCIKAPNGKASAMFYKEDMVFKLTGEPLMKRLALMAPSCSTPWVTGQWADG